MLSSGRVISIAISLGVSSRPSTRAFTTTIASASSSSPYCSIVFGNTITSIAAREILQHERRHEVAALRVLARQAGDDAGDVADRAVVELGQIRDRALDVPAQRRFGAHQRVIAHVEAEHLLLGAQLLGLVEVDVGDRQAVVEHRAVVGGAAAEVEQAHRSLVALAPAAQRRVDDRLEHLQQTLARMAERVERARLDQRLDRALVEHGRVDPLAEVVEVGERTVGPRRR